MLCRCVGAQASSQKPGANCKRCCILPFQNQSLRKTGCFQARVGFCTAALPLEVVHLDTLVRPVARKQDVVARLHVPRELHEKTAVHAQSCMRETPTKSEMRSGEAEAQRTLVPTVFDRVRTSQEAHKTPGKIYRRCRNGSRGQHVGSTALVHARTTSHRA